MLSEAQLAAVSRACEPSFDGVELLSRPQGWPIPQAGPASPRTAPGTLSPTRPSPQRTPSTPTKPLPSLNEPRRVHIAVLDSSFNPPTLAHLALAASAFPRPLANPNTVRSSSPTSPSAFLRDAASYFASHAPPSANAHLAPNTDDTAVLPDPSPGPYTARLMLLSARNADKRLGPGDATPAQRAEMMLAQAASMPHQAGQTAVALVSAPTFVAKVKALVRLLDDLGVGEDTSLASGEDKSPTPPPSTPTHTRTRALSAASVQSAISVTPGPPALSFLVGTDTLVRIFDPKYYPAGGMDAALDELFEHAWIVCARRGSGGDSADVAQTRTQEDALLARADVAKWVARGRIRLVRVTEAVADVSSSRVRAALRMGAGAHALRQLCADSVAKYVLEQKLYRS